MYVWGKTRHGKGRFTVGVVRKKDERRMGCTLVTDDDNEVTNITSTFARIERSKEVARATGKTFLFSYTCFGTDSSWDLVYHPDYADVQ
jgi:hypothetical protein